MELFTIGLPLTVWLDKKEKFIVNLNNYRNTHHAKLNKAKKKYNEMVGWLLVEKGLNKLKIEGEVVLDYTLFPGDARIVDVANVCSIVDKFTCDALTQSGIWADDNHRIVKGSCYWFGAIDRVNPRCQLTVRQFQR